MTVVPGENLNVAASMIFMVTPSFACGDDKTGDGTTPYLLRHLTGDWGELCEEDKQANEAALKYHLRILSAYHLTDGTKIWLITEWDRSVTTILLPEEY